MEAVFFGDPVITAIYIHTGHMIKWFHKLTLIVDGIACLAVRVTLAQMLIEISLRCPTRHHGCVPGAVDVLLTCKVCRAHVTSRSIFLTVRVCNVARVSNGVLEFSTLLIAIDY